MEQYWLGFMGGVFASIAAYFLGRIYGRWKSKVGTPSASHNTGMVSSSKICPYCDGMGIKRGFGAVLPTRCYCSHCKGTGKLHHT